LHSSGGSHEAPCLVGGPGCRRLGHGRGRPRGGAPRRPAPSRPYATVATSAGELVAVALPQRSGGRVWRIARSLNASVLHELSEANVGATVVVVFKTTHRGDATISFGLTQGETRTALESRTYKVHVR